MINVFFILKNKVLNQNYIVLCLFCFFFTTKIEVFYAQSIGSKVVVDSIIIEGNKKTKEKVIFRELTFAKGDSIDFKEINDVLEKNRLLLMNSTMFADVSINIKKWNENAVVLLIKVREVFPIIPAASLSFADRNFNVWWKEKNHDFKRLNYFLGARFINPTGNRDVFKASLQFGFGQKAELTYKLPNIGRKNQFGFYANVYMARYKEVWYATQRDSLLFYRDESNFLLKKFRASVGFSFRPKIRSVQYLRLQYNKDFTNEDVIKNKNSNFFAENQSKQQYLSAQYRYTLDYRNIRPYPTKGAFVAFEVEKQGFLPKDNVNALYGSFLYAQYFSLSKKISTELVTKARYEFTRKRQPYYNLRAIGYGADYLRGYEYYVVDGTDFAYLKTSFRYEWYNKKIDLGDFLPENVRYIPFRANVSINNDFGKVHNTFNDKSNMLPNRWLWGKGIGLDFIIYYNMVFQLEYSVNHLNKGGFFVHIKTPLE
jgi:outer membrane protein assembly factor BamA